MARILITGAHGFIGRHLARAFAAAGNEVVGLGHGIWPEPEARACGVSHWINGDITPTNLQLLDERAGAPDHVVHLAGGSSVGLAIANPREDFFRTVATTAELLEWMRLAAPEARVLVASSAAVYGAGHDGPIPESAQVTPCSPYGYHKRVMEELCASYAETYGLRVVVVRLFSVFGPGLKKQLLWDACSRLHAGAETLALGGTGDELRDWTDARDVARALSLLLETDCPPGAIFNVGTGVGTPVHRIAEMLTTAWAGDAVAPAVEFSGRSRPGDPFSLVADPRLLAGLCFHFDVELEHGIADYVRWFRKDVAWGR
jgi:UDP-glucose 4-epimerase